MTTEMEFTSQSTSIAGAPTIEFKFNQDVCTTEFEGVKLWAECVANDRAELTIRDSEGCLLADIVVHKIPQDESITVSVINIGSALLWSHYRWQQASNKEVSNVRNQVDQ